MRKYLYTIFKKLKFDNINYAILNSFTDSNPNYLLSKKFKNHYFLLL